VLVPREGGSATASETVPTGGTGTGTGGAPEAGDVATADDQTWVFPFNRPPAPGEGDNQALAVNTEDGSTLYDVAFALVWAEGDTTDNVNSAYALASCRDCTTVAIAFQVVLVVGQSDTIVPQNLAAAVNYNCISCVTAALARQLVLTIERPLSDLAMEELTALWQEIAAFGADLEGLSLGEIQARLTSYEEQIIAIIERDQGPLVPSRTEASASASPTPSGTASPSAGPGAGASPTTSGDGTTTGGTDSDPTAGEPSATTDSEPTTEPTPAEPEPMPTAEATEPTEETAAAQPEPTPTVEPTPTTSTSP
jgi:putative peptide zinc metalloprotease protein